jgi:hypothetical protein
MKIVLALMDKETRGCDMSARDLLQHLVAVSEWQDL